MAQEAADIAMQEQARRRMALRDAMQQVQEARLAYEAKRYTDAVEHYRNALSVLPKADYSQKLEQFIRESLSDALIARAIDYRSVGRTAEAIEFLREAVELAPNNQRAKLELVYTQDPQRTNPALSPEHVGDVHEVVRLLNLAQGYYDLGKFDEAEKAFQAVGKIDPYNSAAQRGLERVAEAKNRFSNQARLATRAAMISEIDKGWDINNRPDEAPTDVPNLPQGENQDPLALEGEIEQSHATALEKMIVPGFVLDNATIDETIDILSAFVRRFEDSGIRSNRTINVSTDFGPANPEDVEKARQKRVSLQLNDLSLKDILDEISKVYDMEYYIDPAGVHFALAGQGLLVTRTFTGVPAHLFEGGAADDDDDDDDSSSGGRLRVRKVDPVAVLKASGVTFPRGASVVYNSASRLLRVRNTASNIAKIAEFVNDQPEKEWLVVLNIIAVEVSQNDLEDLGFDWMFNVSLNPNAIASGGVEQASTGGLGLSLSGNHKQVPPRQAPLVTSGLRSIQEAENERDIARLIEYGSVRNFSSEEVSSRSPSIFGIRGVWNTADVSMIMRGLSQKKGADVLYSPSLVFSPGMEEAVSFINVREMYIPQNYDPPQITQGSFTNYDNVTNRNVTTGGMAVAISAQPTDFVRYGVDEDNMGGVGTVVRVHKAEPSPDGRTVRMAITTVVNDLEGFVDWGSPIYAAMWSGDDRIERVLLTDNHIFQPIFKRYLTNTEIIIANGAVLVMGGMKEARAVRYEDKVPVLGDLPLVGRLFRSEGEHTTRRALIFFAKVKIVDPTGQDIRGTDNTLDTDLPQ